MIDLRSDTVTLPSEKMKQFNVKYTSIINPMTIIFIIRPQISFI